MVIGITATPENTVDTKSSRERVERALITLGIETEILEFAASTRTSADAAVAIGCTVAQIAKSVVLMAKHSQRPIIALASGANRVDEHKVAAAIGEPVGKADAEFVRRSTGFAIGGVAPIGHTGPVELLVDEDLLRLDPVWAAAGTPNSVFRLSSNMLPTLPGARVIALKQE